MYSNKVTVQYLINRNTHYAMKLVTDVDTESENLHSEDIKQTNLSQLSTWWRGN